MCGEPGTREQERRPPRVRGEHDRRGETAHQLHQPSGDEVHRDEYRRAGDAEIEIPGHREVVGQLRVLEMTHARRPDAGDGEPVVEPRRGAAPEIGANGVVHRRQHLQQDEHDPNHPQRRRQAAAPFDRADEATHRDREERRQEPAHQEEGPPGDGECAVGLGQHAREFPFVTQVQALDHWSALPPLATGAIMALCREVVTFDRHAPTVPTA